MIKKSKFHKKNKKAQLKIQEMSFMLMAVVLFFILALLFFVIVKYRGMYREASIIEQEKALSTISKLSDTAEFTCIGSRPLCVDTDKTMIMKDREAYSGFWPLTSLKIVKIYPGENQTLVKCTRENYPDCSILEVYDKQTADEETISTFVSLCRKEIQNNYVYEKCELGKIVAGFKPKVIE